MVTKMIIHYAMIVLFSFLFRLNSAESDQDFRNISLSISAGNDTDGNQVNSSFLTLEKTFHLYHCKHFDGIRKKNRTEELECCSYSKKRFYKRWYSGGDYLTTYLDTLKGWDCPELTEECRKRTFDFTGFTNLVYLRTCNTQAYRNRCFQSVRDLATKNSEKSKSSMAVDNSNRTVSDSDWHALVSGLRSKEMTDEEILEPCTQVALYESDRGGIGRYHEVMEILIPFCGLVWCGFDADTVYGRGVSTWSCLSNGCKAGIGISMAVIAVLGIATLFANVTVIAVYCFKNRLSNSQAVYKATLAFGDSMVGAIVYPTFISSFYLLYIEPQLMGDIIKPHYEVSSNVSDLQPMRRSNIHFNRVFTKSYLDAVGFFTSLSLVMSVYTLMLASVDRMAAVSSPMKYNRRLARLISKYACAVLLLFGLIIATLPVFAKSLKYGLVSTILVSLFGEDAVILYSIAFLVPLIIVWVTTIIIMICSRKYAKIRRRISSVSAKQFSSVERRLAKTLSIMVGVFSLCILPSALILISSLFMDDIYYDRPESLDKEVSKRFVSAEFICVIVLVSNSLWNCFIYSSRQPDFRKAARELYSDASDRVGASALWRSMKRHVSERRSTRASIFTSNSSSALSTKSRSTIDCSDVENREAKLKSISGNESSSTEMGNQHEGRKHGMLYLEQSFEISGHYKSLE